VAEHEHLERLNAGVKSWNDWRDSHWSEPDLSGADLTGLDLTGFNLSFCFLQRAKLTGANLTGALLIGATLDVAELNNACLKAIQAKGISLYASKLEKANLVGAEMPEANLAHAYLDGANLMFANFYGGFEPAILREAILLGANLAGSNLVEADLAGAWMDASILDGANLSRADLESARLTHASLHHTILVEANLRNAKLDHSSLLNANLNSADLTSASLLLTDLRFASLNGAKLQQAMLVGCSIHGVSAWDVNTEDTSQAALRITPPDQVSIEVDSIEVAQLVYLMLNNKKIRDILDAVTAKVVLLLGRFTPERKRVLDIFRKELRKRGLVPVLFDFDGPENKDVTGTIETLARMSRFIIADISDPSSVPHELATLVPLLRTTPVVLLRQADASTFSMVRDLQSYPWVLPQQEYTPSLDTLAERLADVLALAERKEQQLRGNDVC
jgi:uncharacterized protein YjbI with pentapeptide repeats